MKSLEELKTLYNESLFPELRVLETRRKKICGKLFLYAAVITAVVLPLSAAFQHPFPVIVGIMAFAGLFYFTVQGYVASFKTGIIEKIVKSLDHGLSYSRSGFIPESVFRSSRIFLTSPDDYTGDDYVRGKIGETGLEFSEIHAQYEVQTKNGRQHHTIFQGLFVTADFNKHFKGRTVVLPDVAERLFGGFGGFMQKINPARGELIKLEDPEFEKQFVVYGDDQVEARYILSTSLMKRILDFKKKSKRNTYLSFSGSRIYVAIPYTRPLFEPRIFRTLIDFAPIQQYYEDLKLAIDIVDDLNLNTRIWGK